MEGLEEQILNLNQKKTDLLVGLKAAVLNLHQHLEREQQEGGEGDELPSEEGGVAERGASDRKVGVAFAERWSHIPRESEWVTFHRNHPRCRHPQ